MPKLIKRYANRKLYDTERSVYVTFPYLIELIKQDVEFVVFDNRTKSDITADILSMIIFENERKQKSFSPIRISKEIIKHKNGTLSEYLIKLSVFPESELVSSPLEYRPTLEKPKMQKVAAADHNIQVLLSPTPELVLENTELSLVSGFGNPPQALQAP